jgi:hypothetical protein
MVLQSRVLQYLEYYGFCADSGANPTSHCGSYKWGVEFNCHCHCQGFANVFPYWCNQFTCVVTSIEGPNFDPRDSQNFSGANPTSRCGSYKWGVEYNCNCHCQGFANVFPYWCNQCNGGGTSIEGPNFDPRGSQA